MSKGKGCAMDCDSGYFFELDHDDHNPTAETFYEDTDNAKDDSGDDSRYNHSDGDDDEDVIMDKDPDISREGFGRKDDRIVSTSCFGVGRF
jgi:hypothetical protein